MKQRAGAMAPPVAGAAREQGEGGDAITTALRGAADQHLQEGRFTAALPLLRQILERSPADSRSLYALGAALSRSGQPADGLPLLKRAVARNRRDGSLRTELGHALFRLDRYREALSEADEAIDLGDDSIHPRMLRAIALERLREFDGAREAVDKVLQLAPGHADAVIVRARLLRRVGDPAPSIEPLRWIATNTESEEFRYRALHELGMVLDRVGRYDEAFEAFTGSGRARMLIAETHRYPLEGYPSIVAGYAEAGRQLPSMPGLDRSVLAASTPAPAFLVGFPRSGTTLTEQMLAAHPRVVTLEERPAIPMVRSALLGEGGGPSALWDKLVALTPGQAIALRRRYWEVARTFGVEPGPDRIVIDKLPLNLVELPLISRMFPEARIIIVLRDPRDVCLSCFMQDFRLNEAMVHFLDWSRTAALYASVMRLWLEMRQSLANPWIEVRYEETVADYSAVARRILDFLGLPWEERVLRFGDLVGQREVRTPSFQAVAGGITSGAIGRWKRYPQPIERVMPVLGPLIEELGYAAAP